MLFGLPWWALIPIIAIVGGLFLEYRKQELKAEEKRMAGSKEIHELRKIIHGLKTRIDNLERDLASSKTNTTSSLGDIEIDDQLNENDENYPQGRVRN